jgi:hypothetical protein
MLQEVLVSPERLEGSRAIAQAKFFGARGLQVTLQISRCGEIENAITASKVVTSAKGRSGIRCANVEAPTFGDSDREKRSDQLY